jgi:glycosyltransferase involved in cell wall biosynthesis
MKFTIITNVNHIQEDNQYFGYAPYVREMNIWLKYVEEVTIIAPIIDGKPSVIDIAYQHNKVNFKKVPNFNITTFKSIVSSLFKLPIILLKIFQAMKNADHIHLRCPGNMGLLGCLIQMFFPYKTKTAKYAGNWDPKSKQPFTYKLQKYILGNSFLTRNMQVLVYGEWENQSKNIKPFFTATYSELEKSVIQKKSFNSIIRFTFVGSLVGGKNPLYAIKLVKGLVEKGNNILLNLYGDGIQRSAIEDYIKENKLSDYIILKGNQNQEIIKEAYQNSHFVLLPSKSEGWPKAIAEAMFWGCVPVATKVSCVPFMLDNENRGVLLNMNLDKDVVNMEEILNNEKAFFNKSKLAAQWSQKYTTNVFESEIKKLLVK